MAIGRFSINYGSSTGFGGGFGIFDAIKGTFGLSDPAGISLARARDSDNPYVAPRTILSTLANAAAQQAQAALLGQSARPNQTPIPQPVSQTFAATGPGRLEPLVKEGTQTMSLDLGNLLGNLGSQYISARWGTPRGPQVMAPTIQAQGPVAGVLNPQQVSSVSDMLGITPYQEMLGFGQGSGNLPTIPTPGDVTITGSCPPPSYCVDGKTGKVTIKQKRRRRRRLATSSDIRDLSSLKSVLSPADLKMWIATHPS
ncbi:MAG: hypothetical protein HOM55_04420 [Proteobacteria bacterium]|nr:hypothetical protein [Pseudomonadota bacterium]